MSQGFLGSTDSTAPAWRNSVVLHIQRGSDEEREPVLLGCVDM